MKPFFVRDVRGPHVPPVVLASPHSGRDYPPGFLAALTVGVDVLRRAEDRMVDHIVTPIARRFDWPMIAAKWGRTYVDLNRDPADLDPAIISGVPPRPSNARIRAGLGVLPRIAVPGVAIYSDRIGLAEAEARLRHVHGPYHAALGALLTRARDANGYAILIDCHSMPSLPRNGGRPVDIVLGDLNGDSADGDLVGALETALAPRFRTVRNKPYAGGFTTRHHGTRQTGVHAVQLEIDRALYLDRKTMNFSDRAEHMISGLSQAFEAFKRYLDESAAPMAIAAE